MSRRTNIEAQLNKARKELQIIDNILQDISKDTTEYFTEADKQTILDLKKWRRQHTIDLIQNILITDMRYSIH